ncbi:hypothetical protein SAMN03080594_111117 [Arenibacter palladensis]|uniref:Uncharacterized protein n=1 Tax=Arenibacter palladensis TaxID=237373 RepID=A0A1M5GLT6_9FLAO|nr:hypothetical protein SAMN03080594_111117 [Arenibacter palladensis]
MNLKLTLKRMTMKESIENKNQSKVKRFSFRNIPNYIKAYAKTCRESYYHMLSL